MRLKAAGISDVGLKRKLNEDSYIISPDMGLYVIADGMGGHRAGEVASKIVVDTLTDYWIKMGKKENPSFIDPIEKDLPDKAQHLINSISLANLIIHEAQKQPQYHRMGSTVSALLADKNRIWLANVGDSPVYLFSGGRLTLISEEHSVEAEQKNMGFFDSMSLSGQMMKNVLTRALGLNEKVVSYITHIVPDPGDMLLICSDGLTNYASEEAIKAILKDLSASIEQKVQGLVNAAIDGGGGDNITVILLEILEEGKWTRFKNKLKIE